MSYSLSSASRRASHSRQGLIRFGLVMAVVVASLFPASVSEARRSDIYSYRFEQLWSSVVRLVRVDYGFPVRDRDEDIGYLLFDYQDGGRTYPGSFELVRVEENGQSQIRVSVQIPAMPSYIEQMVLDRLARKVRADHGQPAPRPIPPAASSDAEDETDAEEDS